MKTNKEIKEGLLENCVNEDGDIVLSYIDLSDFKGNVYRGSGKVGGDLFQSCNEVEGDLTQSLNKVKGCLKQDSNEVGKNLQQRRNHVKGTLYQDSNKVECDLFQDCNSVKRDLIQNSSRVKGRTLNDFDKHNRVMRGDGELDDGVEDRRFKESPKDMTNEELLEKIIELVGVNKNEN